jgi:hypothetical protein
LESVKVGALLSREEVGVSELGEVDKEEEDFLKGNGRRPKDLGLDQCKLEWMGLCASIWCVVGFEGAGGAQDDRDGVCSGSLLGHDDEGSWSSKGGHG